MKVAQSCLTLCDSMDYTVHGILQARILKGVAFSFSSRSSWPRNWTRISCITGRFFNSWATRQVLTRYVYWEAMYLKISPFNSPAGDLLWMIAYLADLVHTYPAWLTWSAHLIENICSTIVPLHPKYQCQLSLGSLIPIYFLLTSLLCFWSCYAFFETIQHIFIK